jgi:hypothetical protein
MIGESSRIARLCAREKMKEIMTPHYFRSRLIRRADLDMSHGAQEGSLRAEHLVREAVPQTAVCLRGGRRWWMSCSNSSAQTKP